MDKPDVLTVGDIALRLGYVPYSLRNHELTDKVVSDETNDKLILSGAIGRMRNLSNGMVKTNRKIRAIDINDQCQG